MDAASRLKSALTSPEGVALRGRLRSFGEKLENPVLSREFRSRMRGARSYLITGAYTLIVMVCVLAAYGTLANGGEGGPANALASRVGRGIWTWGCFAQGLLVPLLVPTFTCGAITLERERDLLELLLLTRQSALQICLGKWGAGVGLGLMLVLSSVPVLSLSLLLGGVAPEEIAACLAVLCSAVLAVGSFGLALSTLTQKTVTSTVLTYGGVGFVMVGLPLLTALMGGASSLQASGSDLGILAMLAACLITAFPPAAACAGFIYAVRRRRGAPAPSRTWWIMVTGLSWALLLLLLYLPGMSNLLLQGDVLLLLHPVVVIQSIMSPPGWTPTSGLLWVVCTISYLGLAFWFLFVAVSRVKAMRMG